MIEGLNLVDIYTEQGEGRLISNIVLQSDLFDMPVVGFENHGGRPVSMATNLWERFCTVLEMMERPVMKALFTRM